MATALKRTVYTRTTGAAVPATREPADPALQRFLDAVWLERGLSANTLAAYRADLTALARWLEERDSALLKATRLELLGFIAARVEGGSRPRSTARQLSSFRRFFRFMMREGLIEVDPTAQIAMPKIGRSLPKSLTEAEVDGIINRVHTPQDRPKPKVVFERNEQVRIVDGPFANFNGNVEEIDNDHSRLKVSVTIFGRSTPVELDFASVEKLG